MHAFRATFNLGKQVDYNTWLQREDINYTYLVPSNQAWEVFRLAQPATHMVR